MSIKVQIKEYRYKVCDDELTQGRLSKACEFSMRLHTQF